MVLSPLYLIQREWPSWDCGRGWQLHFNYRTDGFGATPDGRSFLESPTHHPCQFFFFFLNLMLVNKTRQETKVMRLCSDPMDFIPYSVAWLVSSARSWLLWKRCSFRHFNKWRGKDEIGRKERLFFPFLYHPGGYFIAYKALSFSTISLNHDNSVTEVLLSPF